jgi:uncharacterized membrane protein YbhN (UPF0104 family)
MDESEHNRKRLLLVRTLWTRLPVKKLRIASAIIAAAVVFYGLLTHWQGVAHTLQQFQHASLPWLLLGLGIEAAALSTYALIIRRLLRLGDVKAPVHTLLEITVVGIAMTNSLPGGRAISTAYWYEQLRKRGASRALAAIVMFAGMATGLVTLLYLALLGVAVAGSHSALGGVRGPILIGAALFLAVRFYFHKPIARGFRWLARRVAGSEEPIVARRVPPREFATIMLLGYLNWLLDCVVLLAALTAVHASVAWVGVLLAYTLGQLVATIPLLPGGGGTVEASLSLGLIAAGGATGRIVAGVILYRLISAWGIVPLGWGIWALARRSGPRTVLSAAALPPRRAP